MIRKNIILTILVLSSLHFNSGCEVTVTNPSITTQIGETAVLEWQIIRPYNFLFNEMVCYKMKGDQREKQILQGTAHIFKTTEKTGRITFQKKNTRHIIRIANIQQSDAGTYKCFVTCISAKLFYYEQKIDLIVKDKQTGTNDGSSSSERKDGSEEASDRKRNLTIGIVVTGVILFILIAVLVIICAKKGYYKIICSTSDETNNTKTDVKKDASKFEEQQYADLTEFQQNHYGELNAKEALWHDYEYVDPALIKAKGGKKKKDSITSTTYEYVDPKTQFRKASRDFV